MVNFNSNEVIAITGGTGSFGRRITKAFLGTKIGQIRIISRDEKKQEEVRNEFKDERIKFSICDVRDFDAVFNSNTCAKINFLSCFLNSIKSFTTNSSVSHNIFPPLIMLLQ